VVHGVADEVVAVTVRVAVVVAVSVQVPLTSWGMWPSLLKDVQASAARSAEVARPKRRVVAATPRTDLAIILRLEKDAWLKSYSCGSRLELS